MNVDSQSADSPRFKDRSIGLIIFGALQIVMGCGCALLIPFMLLSLLVAPPAAAPMNAAPMNMQMMLPAVGFYGLAAVVLVSLGVGSIRARRWARALTLVLAWMWLVMGVMGVHAVVPTAAKRVDCHRTNTPLGMLRPSAAVIVRLPAVISPGSVSPNASAIISASRSGP